ncbi:MAG: hypothetical protein ABIP20_01870, partial [Chthoniobacteraceae bacterium]
LSPLTSLPLNELYLVGCENVTDVAVLAEIPTLEKVVVPVHSKNIEALRKLTRLQRLAFQHTDSFPWIPITTAEEFWQQWPGMTWARALNEAGMKYTAKQDAEGKWSITVTSKNFSDCSIFKGAAIRELTLTGTAVSDLSPLHGMTMKKLWLGGTKVTDLEPLRGMALRELTLSGTKVTDLRPIEGMPLDWLHLRGTAVKDLSVLRGMPLVNLWLDGCTELTDLSPLAEAKKLNKLFLPPNPKSIEFLRAMPGLEWIDFTENANKDKTAAEFWKEYDTQLWLKTLRDSGVAIKPAKQLPDGTWEVDLRDTKLSDLTMLKGAPISSLSLDNTDVSDLSPLRGMALKTLGLNHTKVTDLSPLQGLPLEELSLYGTRVTNISVLRGVPLKTLDLSGTSVTDLEPLRGMALKKLWLHNTKVAELRPLEQMPLELLYLAGTKVTDLSALRGMPLTLLKLHDCSELTDLSPLAEAKNLTDLSLPLNAKNLEFLRAFPKLERIDFKSDPKSGYKSAADFWKEYDTQGWLRTLRESGAKISALNQLPDGTWDLRIRDAEFSDLTLLRGARISSLEIYGTAVADLTPLRGMPIKKLWIAGTKVSDISALADLPLESLTLHGTAVPHLSPLLKCPTLKSITLPANARNVSVLRALTALERISYSLDSHTNPAQTAAEFWKDYERQAWATALRASGAKISVLKLLPDGTWEVDIPDPKFSDLSLLSGAPISSLRVGQSGVTDLTPLRGMAIKKLYIHTTNVTDLSPLQGMQLELLNVARTKITDFSAVRGMPLKHICLDSTSVADLRAFEELPLTTLRLNACVALSDLSLLTKFKELTNLTLPPNAKDIGFLRDLPKLERISFTDDPKNGYRPDKTAAEFWKEYDAKKK